MSNGLKKDIIDKLRREIDKIDQELIHLLEQRNRLSRDIGHLKKTPQMEIKDPGRESELFARLEKLAGDHNLDRDFIFKVWRNILDESYRVQSETTEND